MKISFQPTDTMDVSRQRTEKNAAAPKAETSAAAYGAYFQPGSDQNSLPLGAASREKGKTLTELQQEAGNMDVGIMQDYKTVLSNTMSPEDYAKMEEEGFDFGSMEPGEAVTIVDKIKAELARSGQQIIGYTDDLDVDTLAAALGSPVLAQAVGDSFSRQNIPLTEENIDQIRRAWDMASQLQEPGESSYLYLVDNGMEPEIWNFYLAQNSGVSENAGQAKYFAEEIGGYYAQSASGESAEEMQEEIGHLLEREGIANNVANRETAGKLLEGGVPIDQENIERLERLQSVSFPVTEEVFAKAAAAAIGQGREAVHADLTRSESIYERAEKILSRAEWLEEGMDIEARKQMEEIRLRMTAEVNVKLLKSGFSIDTAPMEQLIQALRQAEAQVAEEYFPKDAQAVEKYELFHETNRIVGEIPTLPAATVGRLDLIENGTLGEFHTAGAALREEYVRAGESYENLMTAPRRDLGDSMRKAFANVDELLKGLELEPTEENRKAVRILGYNRMEVNVENIAQVEAAEEQVHRVVNRMTPAAVLRMIRDGRNPLNSSFAELEQYFDSLPEEYREQAESYSRFLYGLERNHDITEQERESFIGIYRLLHQVEASDGAAVGSLVNSGAELHFSNLLSAVRSGRFRSLDARISDSFGATVEVMRSGESISDQIARGFVETTREALTQMAETEDSLREYNDRQLEELREAAKVTQEEAAILDRAGLPASADNLLAAWQLTGEGANLFGDWKALKEKYDADFSSGQTKEQMENLLEDLEEPEAFRANYAQMTEELQEEVRLFSLEQAQESLDVRALQMIHKQLGIMRSAASSEEYVIPLYLGEEVAKVHLTLEQGGAQKGAVHISTTLPEEEPIEAMLQYEEGKIGGLLIGNSENAVTKLKEIADIFYDSLKASEEAWEPDRLPVVSRGSRNRPARGTNRMSGASSKTVSNRELFQIAKIFLQSVKRQGGNYEN